MDIARLQEIIQRLRTMGQEWETVDAKRDMILREDGDKAELVKDIVAMANNCETSYLIVGIQDSTFADVGQLSNHYTTNDINQMLSGRIDPPIAIVYQEFTINGNEYAVIEVNGDNPPYIVAQTISPQPSNRKQSRVTKGTIYLRQQDRTEGISRSGLDRLEQMRRSYNVFSKESDLAKSLVRNKPAGWEYLLTSELLERRMSAFKQDMSDLKRGLIYKPTRIMKGKEFIDWIQAKSIDLISIVGALNAVFNEELQIAWGEPGVAGDALKIYKVANIVEDACRNLFSWESELRFIRPPDAFLNLKSIIEGWAEKTFEAIEEAPGKIRAPFQYNSVTGDYDLVITGNYTINIVFTSPVTDEFSNELARLERTRGSWIDKY